jgi:hypothetical protein
MTGPVDCFLHVGPSAVEVQRLLSCGLRIGQVKQVHYDVLRAFPPQHSYPKAGIEAFCFPRGPSVANNAQAAQTAPSVHSFVLTEDTGVRVHACCLTFSLPLGQLASYAGLSDPLGGTQRRPEAELEDIRDCAWLSNDFSDFAEEHGHVHTLELLRSAQALLRAKLEPLEVQPKLKRLFVTYIAVGCSSPVSLSDSARSQIGCELCFEHLETICSETTQLLLPLIPGFKAARDSSHILVPQAFVLLSQWPFWRTLEKCLNALADILDEEAKSSSSAGPLQHSTAHCNTPLSRWIAHLVREIPLPPQGRTSVRFTLGNRSIEFSRPPLNQLPLLDIDLTQLFRLLSVNNVLTLLSAALSEQRILFVSTDYHVLGLAAESLNALLFPLKWRYVYIPVLPSSMLDYLSAPMPFIIGIHKEHLPRKREQLDELVVVMADEDTIYLPADPPLPVLPSSEYATLHKRVSSKLQQLEVGKLDVEQTSRGIRVIFVHFFVSLLHEYRRHITGWSRSDRLFDSEGFIEQHPWSSPSDRTFLDAFLSTQVFSSFIEDHVRPSRNAFEVMFFDECVDSTVPGQQVFKSSRLQTKEVGMLPQSAFFLDTSQRPDCPHWVPPPQDCSAPTESEAPHGRTKADVIYAIQWTEQDVRDLATAPLLRTKTIHHDHDSLLQQQDRLGDVLESLVINYFAQRRAFSIRIETAQLRASHDLRLLKSLNQLLQVPMPSYSTQYSAQRLAMSAQHVRRWS